MKNIFLGILSMLLWVGCARFGNQTIKNTNTERIECISKQYSEIIFALHAQKNIVAVDLSSTYQLR